VATAPGVQRKAPRTVIQRENKPKGPRLERKIQTNFTDAAWRQAALGNQSEGIAMVYRNEKGQFINETAAIRLDLSFFISEWRRWALEAKRKGDHAEAERCLVEMRDCRQKLSALTA
jgi:hypothetical protein